MKQGHTHPEGMPEATNLAPLSGCDPNFMHGPVVALCLPPANFLNRFAVNHKKQQVDHKTLQSCSGRTRALLLSMNLKNVLHARKTTVNSAPVLRCRFTICHQELLHNLLPLRSDEDQPLATVVFCLMLLWTVLPDFATHLDVTQMHQPHFSRAHSGCQL